MPMSIFELSKKQIGLNHNRHHYAKPVIRLPIHSDTNRKQQQTINPILSMQFQFHDEKCDLGPQHTYINGVNFRASLKTEELS